ncbi:MAG TPA: choice-of-anchor Q domain-containing protein [Chitinophagaceae bacterium]|nr:choice-of-anchor Q domain-containing protein [Chitinophagaceae bacterium]
MKTLGILTISILFVFFSCKKESFITSPDAVVTITADTLKYDTVFVTSGSITQFFKIVNENNQKLRLSTVKLMGGNGSAFKINVDGTIGPEVDNLEINANDSIYVFVQVNVNQSSANLPFVIRDSIQVSYNGNNKFVQLEAWGQNAHFLVNKEVNSDEIWNNDLPYVILGYLHVQSNKILTINKGCRIYVNAAAPIVIDGTLQVNGSKDTIDRVSFQGERLDDPYKYFPASWPGIFFNTNSSNNILNYAVIKNSYQSIAVQDPSVNANPKVMLNECVIDNSYDAGIITVNSSLQATNCLISNCGKNIYLLKGGNYQFIHCTVASFSNNFINHRDPVLTVTNFVTSNNVVTSSDLNALFRNCIFWGDGGGLTDEVVVSKNGSTVFNVNFDYNLWKVQNVPSNIISNQTINNVDPLFDSINTYKNYYDFRLKSNSPAIDKGSTTGVTIDLDGNSRPVGLPDLGCFEKH